MGKKNRNWIFTSLLIIGIIGTLIMVATQSNIMYKNTDFSTNVYFEGEEADSGYLILERNDKTPSTFDWVEFGNNESKIFFSDSIIKEKVYVDLPSTIESGRYYFNVKAVFSDGKEEIKEIKFRVI